MVCKSCKNKNFKPTEDLPRPLVNLGKKKFGGVDYRYYMCVQCGYKFVTKEEFEREINIINKTSEVAPHSKTSHANGDNMGGREVAPK